jgi:hypothetical protein
VCLCDGENVVLHPIKAHKRILRKSFFNASVFFFLLLLFAQQKNEKISRRDNVQEMKMGRKFEKKNIQKQWRKRFIFVLKA